MNKKIKDTIRFLAAMCMTPWSCRLYQRSKKSNLLRILMPALLLTFILLSFTACGASAEDKATSASETSLSPSTSLQVHYIDVGQGDATLITCDGSSMLIDAGDNDKGTAVQLYLEKQNISSLDYVIGTHPDSDHIGGLDVIITKFNCGTILLTDEEKDTATFRDVKSAIDYRGYKKTSPAVGTEYALGSAKFTILAPQSLEKDSNENSIAVLLQHGSNRFYFEGDAGEKEEASILSAGIDISANVYKAGHHGSKTSTSDSLLNTVDPAYAVISAGEGNSYGHPNAETLNKFRDKGIQVFRTDEQGSIIAASDGENITWNCSPSESWQAGEANGGSTDSGNFAAENDIPAADSTPAAADTPPVTEASKGTDAAAASNAVVHITESGSKYHSAGCKSLKKSDITVTLDDAKSRGLTPCSKCSPPQ